MSYHLRKQRTLAQTAVVEGFGYWTGEDVRVEFRPAAIHTGVVFIRSDLEPPRRIPARAAHRIETPRRTTLAADGTTIEMVEHILAALQGLQIDNCQVWVDRPEMPGCDGSSLPFVESLLAAGVEEQNAARAQLVVNDVTRVGDDNCWVEARPAKSPGFSLKYHLDYGTHQAIGRQTLELVVTPERFRSELAPARTFILQQEADWLRQRGLAKRVTFQDVLVYNNEGPQDNELRFEDECVRHKALDLIGDLALAGCDIIGHVVAYRSGHRLNAQLVRALLAENQLVDGWRRTA